MFLIKNEKSAAAGQKSIPFHTRKRAEGDSIVHFFRPPRAAPENQQILVKHVTSYSIRIVSVIVCHHFTPTMSSAAGAIKTVNAKGEETVVKVKVRIRSPHFFI